MLLEDILNTIEKNKNRIYCEKMTYGMLYEKIYKLYSYILQLKKENKFSKRIIVYGSKDIEMIIAFLACSYAGITYIPVDISCTSDRLERIIEETKPITILTKEIINQIINEKVEIKEIIPLLKSNDTYYTIFTSGSTGVPKGVEISYKNLDTFTKRIIDTIPVKHSSILNQALYSFDLSVADIYLTLLTGSEYIILDRIKIDEYEKMFEKIKRAQVIIATPTFLDFLLIDKSFKKDNCKELKYIYLCGEILKKKTVEKVYERFSDIQIINAYGPTECTVAITSTKIRKDCEKVAVGDTKDSNFVILDNNLNSVKEKEIGNIVIYGDQVAKGYTNYSNDSFIKYNDQRAYITGDLGYIEDNRLYFVGRKDRQIKLGGYRIELAEIESKILEIANVKKCVVVPKYKDEKVESITAYIVSNTSSDTLKKQIKEKLPHYMIPNIKIVDQLPVNNNFKTDVKRIEELENERKNNWNDSWNIRQ